jgi:peptidoglycan hydrolase CwlO-like protein
MIINKEIFNIFEKQHLDYKQMEFEINHILKIRKELDGFSKEIQSFREKIGEIQNKIEETKNKCRHWIMVEKHYPENKEIIAYCEECNKELNDQNSKN